MNIKFMKNIVTSQKGTCLLTFNVQENKSLIPTVSVWSTEDVTAFKLGLYEYNFMGKNATIGDYYQYNYFHSGGVSFSSPYLFSNQWGLETHLQQRSSKEPIFFNNTSANYEYTNTSFEVLANYQLNFNNRFKFGYSFFNEKYTYFDGATDPRIPSALDIDKMLFKIEYSFNNVKRYVV